MTNYESCEANSLKETDSFDNGVITRGSGVVENSIPILSWTNFRPRGSLARVLYDRQQHDAYLSEIDKNEWYQVDLQSLPQHLAAKFIQLEPDEDTLKFLDESERKSDWVFTQVWHTIVKAFLGWFMTQTSINGWLQRGSMFVLSQQQFLKLLKVESNENWKSESLLDLGAGDGEVTARLAPYFEKVYVTEVSGTMRNLLNNKGYQILEIDSWHLDRKFDFISCLNLVDRCDTPVQLLSQIRTALNRDGLLLIAVVLPFSAYVESGSPDSKPKELLPIVGATFEDQVQSITDVVFKPAKFEVVSWTRVPYLCEGDLHQSYYWLDDAVFILKRSEE